jgi:hypothetical protein
MTRESQDRGEELEIGIEQYEQYLLLCMRAYRVLNVDLSDNALFSGISNDIRSQIKNPSTDVEFQGIRWARLTGLMDKKPTNIVCTIHRPAASSRKLRFKSNGAVNLLS